VKTNYHHFVQVERGLALPFAVFGLALTLPDARALLVLQSEHFQDGGFLAGMLLGSFGAFLGFPYAPIVTIVLWIWRYCKRT
jgi:hypothetical protein